MAKLGEIGKIITGNTPKTSDENNYSQKDIKFIKPSDILENEVTELSRAEAYISEYARRKARIVPAGSILVTCIGIIGKVGIAVDECAFNQQINAVIPDNTKCLPRYLAYAISNEKNKLQDKSNAAVVPIINKTQFSDMEISLPSINKQQYIVNILDKISCVMVSRRQQLQKLHELVKSRFIEMFGDPVNNEKGWITDTVDNLCIEIYGGGTPSKVHPEYYEDGDIPWVSSKDMKTDTLTDSQIKINQMGVENSTARMVPVNSVIMVIRSGILKHTLPVAINAVPITVNQDLKVFIPSERILTRFLAVQFKMHEKDILTGVRAVTADNIEFNSLKQRKLIVPSIKLQQEYVSFLEQVDKSKLAVQKSLEQLEILKKSLMQAYFG